MQKRPRRNPITDEEKVEMKAEVWRTTSQQETEIIRKPCKVYGQVDI